MSQSLLYKPLCYVKDLLKLLSSDDTKSENFRLTSVPALTGFVEDQNK